MFQVVPDFVVNSIQQKSNAMKYIIRRPGQNEVMPARDDTLSPQTSTRVWFMDRLRLVTVASEYDANYPE